MFYLMDMTCGNFAQYFTNDTQTVDSGELVEVTSCHQYWQYFNDTTMQECLAECGADTLMFGSQCVTTCPAKYVPSGSKCVDADV